MLHVSLTSAIDLRWNSHFEPLRNFQRNSRNLFESQTADRDYHFCIEILREAALIGSISEDRVKNTQTAVLSFLQCRLIVSVNENSAEKHARAFYDS